MTRILIQRGSSGGGSTNSNRSSASGSSSSRGDQHISTPQQAAALKDEEIGENIQEHTNVDVHLDSGSSEMKIVKTDDVLIESTCTDQKEVLRDVISGDCEKALKDDIVVQGELKIGLDQLQITERDAVENERFKGDSSQNVTGSPPPPPPPAPPLKPSLVNSNSRRPVSGSSNAGRIGSSRWGVAWPVVATRTSPTGSRPSSPRSHVDNDGYNSADEQNSHFVPSYYDPERERQFEIEIRLVKGLEVKRMLEDGNCLFRAIGDQVYGDTEAYDLIRQMCIDYMERERDHFSQFITEGFTSYCKRKRRDKVYGNNAEIQALSEMYNRPIHIFCYGTEPINIFHGNYKTDPPIRLSYHHGNHYNSLVDPRRLSIGAGLGFSSLRGANIDKDKVKAALKSQQDQQIDNALLAQGRYYSDLELTEKEIERMVMEASRAEYLASEKQLSRKDSSTSSAEPSSSGARSSGSQSNPKMEGRVETGLQDSVLSRSMQMVLSMGFSYLQVIEAYSIFGDDVDSVVCYLLETGNSSRRKGKATE